MFSTYLSFKLSTWVKDCSKGAKSRAKMVENAPCSDKVGNSCCLKPKLDMAIDAFYYQGYTFSRQSC